MSNSIHSILSESELPPVLGDQLFAIVAFLFTTPPNMDPVIFTHAHNDLLHFTLKVLALYQVGYIVVVIIIFPTFPTLTTPILLLQ